MNMKSALLGRSTSNHQSANTPAALAHALEAADAKVPQKEHAADFLTNTLEPSLALLLERRSVLLRHLNPDLDELARAQLDPNAGTPQSSATLDADLPTVERAIQIKRHAMQLQGAIVERERGRWSAIACNELKNHHRQQVRRIAAALEELSAALADHSELLAGLREHDVNFTAVLRPMTFPRDSMLLNDETSNAAVWMRDAQSNGLLD
jgi:hypothetical protein